MIIEKINENRIKISFSSEELEENNISVHSFLSNSIKAQKFILAILAIANEEFNFNTDGFSLNSETISFNNKEFIIFLTKEINKNNYIENELVYKFYNFNDFLLFSKFCQKIFIINNINNSLYKFNNTFYLKINIEYLNYSLKNKILALLSEYKSYMHISDLCIQKLVEYSELLIKDNAIQKKFTS